MAVADEVWMLEHAVYSILSPEGFASILWKDSKKAKEAARVMQLTSWDLKNLGIVEHVIPEAEKLTKENMCMVTEKLYAGIQTFLEQYGSMSGETLATHRYERFRKM